MKLWKPGEEEEDEVDLTPMIDIVFLLIVFFMTVANMITAEKVPISMAVATHSVIPEDYGERTTITVRADGTTFAGSYEVTLDELSEILQGYYEEDPRVKVYLRADRSTEHQFVNDVMKRCAAAGLSNVVFAAYQSDK